MFNGSQGFGSRRRAAPKAALNAFTIKEAAGLFGVHTATPAEAHVLQKGADSLTSYLGNAPWRDSFPDKGLIADSDTGRIYDARAHLVVVQEEELEVTNDPLYLCDQRGECVTISASVVFRASDEGVLIPRIYAIPTRPGRTWVEVTYSFENPSRESRLNEWLLTFSSLKHSCPHGKFPPKGFRRDIYLAFSRDPLEMNGCLERFATLEQLQDLPLPLKELTYNPDFVFKRRKELRSGTKDPSLQIRYTLSASDKDRTSSLLGNTEVPQVKMIERSEQRVIGPSLNSSIFNSKNAVRVHRQVPDPGSEPTIHHEVRLTIEGKIYEATTFQELDNFSHSLDIIRAVSAALVLRARLGLDFFLVSQTCNFEEYGPANPNTRTEGTFVSGNSTILCQSRLIRDVSFFCFYLGLPSDPSFSRYEELVTCTNLMLKQAFLKAAALENITFSNFKNSTGSLVLHTKKCEYYPTHPWASKDLASLEPGQGYFSQASGKWMTTPNGEKTNAWMEEQGLQTFSYWPVFIIRVVDEDPKIREMSGPFIPETSRDLETPYLNSKLILQLGYYVYQRLLYGGIKLSDWFDNWSQKNGPVGSSVSIPRSKALDPSAPLLNRFIDVSYGEKFCHDPFFVEISLSDSHGAFEAKRFRLTEISSSIVPSYVWRSLMGGGRKAEAPFLGAPPLPIFLGISRAPKHQHHMIRLKMMTAAHNLAYQRKIFKALGLDLEGTRSISMTESITREWLKVCKINMERLERGKPLLRFPSEFYWYLASIQIIIPWESRVSCNSYSICFAGSRTLRAYSSVGNSLLQTARREVYEEFPEAEVEGKEIVIGGVACRFLSRKFGEDIPPSDEEKRFDSKSQLKKTESLITHLMERFVLVPLKGVRFLTASSPKSLQSELLNDCLDMDFIPVDSEDGKLLQFRGRQFVWIILRPKEVHWVTGALKKIFSSCAFAVAHNSLNERKTIQSFGIEGPCFLDTYILGSGKTMGLKLEKLYARYYHARKLKIQKKPRKYNDWFFASSDELLYASRDVEGLMTVFSECWNRTTEEEHFHVLLHGMITKGQKVEKGSKQEFFEKRLSILEFTPSPTIPEEVPQSVKPYMGPEEEEEFFRSRSLSLMTESPLDFRVRFPEEDLKNLVSHEECQKQEEETSTPIQLKKEVEERVYSISCKMKDLGMITEEEAEDNSLLETLSLGSVSELSSLDASISLEDIEVDSSIWRKEENKNIKATFDFLPQDEREEFYSYRWTEFSDECQRQDTRAGRITGIFPLDSFQDILDTSNRSKHFVADYERFRATSRLEKERERALLFDKSGLQPKKRILETGKGLGSLAGALEGRLKPGSALRRMTKGSLEHLEARFLLSRLGGDGSSDRESPEV
jgi:hypothetical protein